jgi:asparagine synthase (glutamine-hydrolysing)
MSGFAGFIHNASVEVDGMKTLSAFQSLITQQWKGVTQHRFSQNNIHVFSEQTNELPRRAEPSSSGGVFVWLEGEWFNGQELADEFNVPTSLHDSEILLRLYEADSTFNFLRKIDGIYAAVIYDSARQLVHIACDRYGIRRCYWWRWGESVFGWATQAKAFLGLPLFRPVVNSEAVEELLHFGSLIGNHALLEGVERLRPATILTFAARSGRLTERRYWHWTPMGYEPNRDEAISALAELLRESVQKCATRGGRTGIMLSGGLDSRAMLAAMPKDVALLPSITFSKPGSRELTIARLVASTVGVDHHVYLLGEGGWLSKRFEGVWWADGELNLIHMHGIEYFLTVKGMIDVELGGLGGDGLVGGGHLFAHEPAMRYLRRRFRLSSASTHLRERILNYVNGFDSSHALYVDHGIRRFTSTTPSVGLAYGLDFRLPFLANPFQEYLFSIPFEWKRTNKLYRTMLLDNYPLLFAGIPWAKTGMSLKRSPIVSSVSTLARRLGSKTVRELPRFGLSLSDPFNYTDYATWLRAEPSRSLAKEILNNPAGLYREFVSADQVGRAVDNHMRGEDCADELGRYLTLEVWLQQVFRSRFRPVGESA